MTWEETINFVKQIPYGRNTNRSNFSLVITEKKGSCSSKHAYLKEFANKHAIPNVQLIIGIYKMTESNTKIGTILSNHAIDYLPEAHCYLKIDGTVIDATTINSNFEAIKDVILEEIEIEPYQVGEFKIDYHQAYIKKWIIEKNIPFVFDEIWSIREKCIEHLATQ